ncbi:MAG TPA: type VI secretion system protein TssA, partial [Pyrinomonadaceae bacterium]|nr:type VI secretion system protein TssA [Pyrinomonadaceae bacterium]
MNTDTPYAFDLERLLEPISAERPAGEQLRYDGTYDRIREARREDDPRLSQGIYQSELKRADWPAVEALALEALTSRTKDLQLAAWLAESWLYLYGFAGAREGLALLAGLCERFWDGVHPEIGEDGFENRIAPIIWVNEKLSLKLKQLHVSSPQAGDVEAYTYADWESACHLENLALRDPKGAQAAEARGAVTTSKFHSSVMLTDRQFYVTL